MNYWIGNLTIRPTDIIYFKIENKKDTIVFFPIKIQLYSKNNNKKNNVWWDK